MIVLTKEAVTRRTIRAGVWSDVRCEIVMFEGFEDWEFFVYPDVLSGTWSVVESSTGAAIPNANLETKNATLEKAWQQLQAIKPEGFKKALAKLPTVIHKHLQKHGVDQIVGVGNIA